MSVQPSPSRTVGGYTLLARLGEGGMGVVHLARKPGGPRVALKVLRPHIVGDEEARARLAREVSSLERIRSHWVAEIVDADPWAPTPYVATRYVPGLSLHDHVPEEGPIQGDDLRWFARCLAEGVATVHAAGVLHRDVKPSNVLLEGRTPILIDFGLARVADDPRLTHTGWLLGTPGYLAPEILYGEDATPASDVHSWAATVAYAGSGNPPFGRGPSMAIMDRVRRGEHDLNGLPDDLRRLVAAALDPEPARRPGLTEIRARLADPGTATAWAAPRPPVADDDPFTLPLAIASHDQAAAVTRPPTVVRPPTGPVLPASAASEWASHPASEPDSEWESGSSTRRFGDDDVGSFDLAEAAPREGPLPVARRAVLLLALGLTVAAALASWPYPTLAAVVLLVWLLRTCALVATAADQRRQLRGARWYDVVLAPLSAPWYLLAAVPGTVLLCLWAAGIGAAGALLCYALSLGIAATLFVSGCCLALSLWLGPGSTQLRWPVRVIVQPLARHTGRWAVVVLLLLGLTGIMGHLASTRVSWTPFGQPSLGGLGLGL